MKLATRLISSLEKVFPEAELAATPFESATAAKGEVFSFQLAIRSSGINDHYAKLNRLCFEQLTLGVEVESKLPVEVRFVQSVPVTVPAMVPESNYLRQTPGLYPDYLRPLGVDRCFRIPGGQYHALWVTVRVPEDCRAGKYPVKLIVRNAGNDRKFTSDDQPVEAVFTLEVLPVKLEKQKLLRYEWFHIDCLKSFYGVDTWSDEHWRIIENFIRNGVAHGLNVLLTPLWTPPLDTVPGGERPTTQLLIIGKKGKKYTFDFSRLERYLKLALECGITHFAMSHAFTQWGAKATPKIVATVNGKEQRIFGWDVPSDSPDYAEFLRQLMPQLIALLRKCKLEKNVFFSTSDEPTEENLESYRKAAKLLESVIEGLPTLEALSSFEFSKRNLVTIPVPSNNHIEPFVGNVKDLWTYYCVSQEDRVPNRFMAMGSARNRVIGVIFYLYDIKGFLQWGFNFYNSLLSIEKVNPFADTCAGNWVPAGDAFIVYPNPDGTAGDSLRHEVFFDAIQDLRALRTLEKKIGREAVVALIHEGLNYGIKMTDYPRSADWLLQLRERVNRALIKK